MASKRTLESPGGSENRRKRHSLSIVDKIELLKKLDYGTSVRKLCELYDIGSSTIYDLKKQREKLLEFCALSDTQKGMTVRKTMRQGKSKDLDKALMQWFQQCRNDAVKISGDMIIAQAKLFHEELNLGHECVYSEGWLHKFKKRHGISILAVCGEKWSADHEAAKTSMDKFAKLVADEDLTSEQINSVDEAVLYWQCMPKRILDVEESDVLSSSSRSSEEEFHEEAKADLDKIFIACCNTS